MEKEEEEEEGRQGGLWDVFSACDDDGDGWVDVEHFVRLAASHLPSEQEAVALGRLLDPKGLGLIDFEGFCRGVSSFGGGGTAHLTAKEHRDGDDCDDGDGGRREDCNAELGPDWDEVGEVTDSAYLGSESAPSETETLPDEEAGIAPPAGHHNEEAGIAPPAGHHDEEAGIAPPAGHHDEEQQWEDESREYHDHREAGAATRSAFEPGDTLGYLQVGDGPSAAAAAADGVAEEQEEESDDLRRDEPRGAGTRRPDVSTPPGLGSEPGRGTRGGSDLPHRARGGAGRLAEVPAAGTDGRDDLPDGRGMKTNACLLSDGRRSTKLRGKTEPRQQVPHRAIGDGGESPAAAVGGDLAETDFESASWHGFRKSPCVGDEVHLGTSWGQDEDTGATQMGRIVVGDDGSGVDDSFEVGGGVAGPAARGSDRLHARHHRGVSGHHDESEGRSAASRAGLKSNPVVNGAEEFEESGENEEAMVVVMAPPSHNLSASDAWSLQAPPFEPRFSTSSPAGGGAPGGRREARREISDTSYCLCCRQRIAQLRELDRRLTQLHLTGPRRRISTKAFARRLLPGACQKSASFSSKEDFFEESPDAGGEVNHRMSLLESKVLELESDSVITCDLQTQIKQENTKLIHRINELEDRLRETEVRTERRSHELSSHHQEALARVELRKVSELEALQARLRRVEEEGAALKATVGHLKTLARRLTEENEALAERLEESACRLSEEATLGRTLTEKLRQDEQHFQHERVATHELIEELRRELEGLQLLRLETERGAALGGARRRLGASAGLQEYQTRTREMELEHEVRRLRQERQRLQEQNEDLSGQIISTSLQGAKSLLSVPTRSRALASNPDGATHEEVVAALHEVEEINDQLRQYMDRVILAILETNPSILEIKP